MKKKTTKKKSLQIELHSILLNIITKLIIILINQNQK